jgi:hypothetical protein
VDKFENLLPLYRPGGSRFQNSLTFFAGKDLLYVMKNDLQEFGFNSKDPITEFLERVVPTDRELRGCLDMDARMAETKRINHKL